MTTQHRHTPDMEKIRAFREERKNSEHAKAPIPQGTYTCRLRELRMTGTSMYGSREGRVAVFEITEGPHAKKPIETRVYGAALAVVEAAKTAGTLLAVDVYVRRYKDGREYSNVNVQTIRHPSRGGVGLSDGQGGVDSQDTSGCDAVPLADGLPAHVVETELGVCNAHVDEFGTGFEIVGEIHEKRRIVNWTERFNAYTSGAMPMVMPSAYLSAYQFQGEPFASYVADQGGSTAGYPGAAYAHLLVFEIDGTEADGMTKEEEALVQARRLVVELLALGIPPEHILIFFSGGRGFHIFIPTSLVDGRPSVKFAKVSGEFCMQIAARCGCTLDSSMYRTLQPLRAPNSRHANTGLYKIHISVPELLAGSVGEIQLWSSTSRPFSDLNLRPEILPAVASAWKLAEEVVAQRGKRPAGEATTVSGSVIYESTWDYLINGAPVGSRANATFKAAANLGQFATTEDLIQVLMARPVTLSGFPEEEAARHIENAIKRSRNQ